MKFKNIYYSKNGKMVFRLDMMPLTIFWLILSLFLMFTGVLAGDFALVVLFGAIAIVPSPLFYPFRYITISDTEFAISIGIFRKKVKFSNVTKCIVRSSLVNTCNGIYFYDANGKRKAFGIPYFGNIKKIGDELSKHVKNIEVFSDADYIRDYSKLSDEAQKIVEGPHLKPPRFLYLFLSIVFGALAGLLGYWEFIEWDSFNTLSDRIIFKWICPVMIVGLILLMFLLLDMTFGYIKVKDETIVIKGLYSKKRLIKASDVFKWRKDVDYSISSGRNGGRQVYVSKVIVITDYNGKEHKISSGQTEHFDDVLHFLETNASERITTE